MATRDERPSDAREQTSDDLATIAHDSIARLKPEPLASDLTRAGKAQNGMFYALSAPSVHRRRGRARTLRSTVHRLFS